MFSCSGLSKTLLSNSSNQGSGALERVPGLQSLGGYTGEHQQSDPAANAENLRASGGEWLVEKFDFPEFRDPD